MTTLVMNYTVNPIWAALRAFGRGIIRTQTLMGYSRAAAELARLGYHEEAKSVMMKYAALKNEK